MKSKISLITLGVRDFPKSLSFYRDGLGFATHNYTVGEDHVMFVMEGSWLSLFSRDKLVADATVPGDGTGFSGMTLAHNVGSREQVEAVFAQAVGPGHPSSSRRRMYSGADITPTSRTLTATSGRWHSIHSRTLPSATKCQPTKP